MTEMADAAVSAEEDGLSVEEIGGSFVPAARPSVCWVEVDGEGVVLDESTGTLHLLNPIATVVWSCFDGSGTLDEVVADLSEVFAADPLQVGHDVMALTRRLGASGLLAGVRPGPSLEQAGETWEVGGQVHGVHADRDGCADDPR